MMPSLLASFGRRGLSIAQSRTLLMRNFNVSTPLIVNGCEKSLFNDYKEATLWSGVSSRNDVSARPFSCTAQRAISFPSSLNSGSLLYSTNQMKFGLGNGLDLSSINIQTRGMASKKHKRVIRMAKGFRGRAKNTFRAAIRRLEKSFQYAYRDRKTKKRNFRKLWIQRVNAGVRQHGISYSRFIRSATADANIVLNRRMLSELASNEPFSFKAVVDVVKLKQK